MKHFNTFLTVLLILFLGSTQSVKAQDSKINWSPYAKKYTDVVDQYVYLYNKTNNAFINAGGLYGMQAVLSSRGIRITLKQTRNGIYYLDGPILNTSANKGSCIGIINLNDNIYIDLAAPTSTNDLTAITFTDVEGTTNAFKISTNGSYYKYDANTNKGCIRANATASDADEWYLITADDYKTVIQNESAQGRYNISGLLLNSRFIRNVSDADNLFWKTTELDYATSDYCTSIAPEFGTGNVSDEYASSYGAFGCLEIGAATGTFYQIVTGLTPGLYAVSAQAFFDKDDQKPYNKDGEKTPGIYQTDNKADASNAYLYANDEKTTIPVLSGDDYNKFKGYVDQHYNGLSKTDKQYFRRNVPAAYFLAQGNQYTPDETFKRVTVYVTVGENRTLKLGVGKDATGGRVYVDNISLYFIGSNTKLGFGVDAYETNSQNIDPNQYQQPYYFYLSRKFNKGQWSAITLPVDILGSQLKQTFGKNVQLCELKGINEKNPNQIMFTPVNLDNSYEAAIKANGCYLIYMQDEPTPTYTDTPFEFYRKAETTDATLETVNFNYGNIYQFEGISCPDGISASGTETTSDGKLSYTYYNYHPTYAPAGSYVMSGGNMYHLTSDWSSLIGTAWYLTETNPSSQTKTLVIDNGSGTTDINGIVTEMPGENTVEGIYNINGQKVASDKSLNDLPKGIYIVNGKKYIVK